MPDSLLDELAARAAIAGERPVLEVSREVAWRGGWPVATESGSFLFVHATDDTAGWSLAGDHNDWSPVPMSEGAGLVWAEVAIEGPAGSGYKFVSGEAWLADPRARSFTYDDFGELSFVRPPLHDWRLDRWPDAQAAGLPARPVHVLVPPGEGPWPTLYAQDGQNLFDPSAYFGGWNLQGAAQAASAPALIVGTFAGPDRLAEYAHTNDDIRDLSVTSRGEDYRVLLSELIRPHVEQVYGTPPIVGLMGSSMGGVASLSIAHADPGSWDFVASLSGTLGWGRFGADGPTLEELYVASPMPEIVIYVDSGGGPGSLGCRDLNGDGSFADDPDHTDNYCTNRAFADALAEHGWVWEDTLYHWHEPGAPHNEAAWAARVHRPLEIFLDMAEGR